jgi:eukaryotic-like serine/threonine-protein kinase
MALENWNPAKWETIGALFLAAADLPAAEQRRFLEAQCDGDVGLVNAVTALLASDRRKGSTILAAVEDAATLMFEVPLLSERLGAYRVEREIGRGGMGTVYLATRDDDQFHKRVAIKVIKAGTDTAEALARFRDERQILADLDHPYIARLLDAGTTPDGRPFFVMDYVEGVPVDLFCRDHRLDVKARCRLFVKICEAVAYAHRNLVIHRDLKPANIFVTPDATPKLLDFGVAKLVSRTASHAQTASALARPITPEYASPEQVLGSPVTTAADVYSLAAVLYELLTEHRAQLIAPGASPKEIERTICETEPTPPRLLAPDLDIDLDNIVLAAMRKEPERRYLSVDQFAEDIRRYLDSRPVIARRDSWWYRSAKFARRQRYPLAAAAVVMLSLVSGIVMTIVQARGARAARHLAELNRDMAISERQRAEDQLARTVTMSDRSLSDVSALMERLPGALPARKELVSNTLAFLEELAKSAGGNAKLQLALATAYGKLGDVEGNPDSSNVGDSAGALRSYRQAIALIGEPARDAERLTLWVDVQDKIAKILPETGGRESAKRVLRQAIEVVDRSNQLPGVTIETLRGRLYLSLSRLTLEPSGSLAFARQSLKAAQDAARQAPRDPAVQLVISTTETQIGFVYGLMGDVKAAEPHYVESMKIRERLASEYPNDLMYRRLLKLSYEHYASLLADPERVNLGRPALARFYFEKARPLEEASAADSQNSLAKFDYALFLLYSARIEVPAAEKEASLAQLRKSAAMIAEMARAEPEIARFGRALSSAHQAIGRRLGEMGRHAESVVEYRHALAVARNLLAKEPSSKVFIRDLFDIELELTRALALSFDRASALRQAQGCRRRAAQLGDTEIAKCDVELAVVYQTFGECGRAIELMRGVRARLASGSERMLSAPIIQQADTILAACDMPKPDSKTCATARESQHDPLCTK